MGAAMLNPKIDEIAREQIRIEFEDRDGQLGRDLSIMVGEFAIRSGGGLSSRAVLAGAEMFHAELKGRATMALNILRRVCSEIGVESGSDLGPSVKAFLNDVIGREADKLFAHMMESNPVSASRGFNMDVRTPYEKVRANALSKVHTEVDLFEARIAALVQQTKASGNQVNVTGSGNVVLTGAFVGSPMNVSIDAGSRATIEKALAVVEDALAKVAEPANFNVAEVRDMIAQSKNELQKPKPNSTLLTTMLVGIATAIQTAGALRPAYDALKWALLPLGITLP